MSVFESGTKWEGESASSLLLRPQQLGICQLLAAGGGRVFTIPAEHLDYSANPLFVINSELLVRLDYYETRIGICL